MGQWDRWIGRSEQRSDRVDAGLVTRWLATFDRDAPEGRTVPQGLHWCLCLPDAPTTLLGADGHPLRDDGDNGFLPPVPLPRRMWASSKVEFITPLRIDGRIERVSAVAALTEKYGSSGTLVFVDIAHETVCDSVLSVREVQTVVYRDAAPSGAPPVPPVPGEGAFNPAPWDLHRMVTPTEALLFRFSALTFNSHRIHYDLPYAQGVEGYRGLVVHGPLTATLLLDIARRTLGDNALKRFTFKGVSPAMCGEPLHLAMRGSGEAIELGAFAEDGRQIMAATAAA